jgi:hypothetical protein
MAQTMRERVTGTKQESVIGKLMVNSMVIYSTLFTGKFTLFIQHGMMEKPFANCKRNLTLNGYSVALNMCRDDDFKFFRKWK